MICGGLGGAKEMGETMTGWLDYFVSYEKNRNMSMIQQEGDFFVLKIRKDLADSAYLQRFVKLLEFRALAKQNHMSQAEAAQLADEVKQSGWAQHRDDFMQGVER